MRSVSAEDINKKIRLTSFEDFDIVVGIGDGGVVPAALIADHLDLDVDIVKINFRDAKNNVKFNSPKLIDKLSLDLKNKNILLVDDVSRTGKTLEKAKKILKGNKITTLVMSGKADYSLFDFKECVKWPWS